jgi:nitrite reductase (NADH) small subunit
MSSLDAGPEEAIPQGRFRLVRLGHREIGLTRWHNQLYAILNVCPHQRGPLCQGPLLGRVSAPRPGTMEPADAPPLISCPWHGWEFELDTGAAVPDARYRVRTFPVTVRDGRVLVEVPGDIVPA